MIALAGARTIAPARAAGRGRRVHELLRPHLHDRQLPGTDRPAADRPQRLPAARQRRRPGRRPRASDQRAGPADRRPGPRAARRRRRAACAGAAHEGLRDGRRRLRPQADDSTAPGTAAAAGTVRRIRDCCGVTNMRINGDAALVGYCYPGRHVFCVTYYETLDAVLSGLVVARRDHGAARRHRRRLVAVRLLDGRHDRHRARRRAPRRDAARHRDVHARRAGRRRRRPSAGSRCVGAAARRQARRAARRRSPAALALAAAVADWRGLRIAPQIRRQVPERWRWIMPLPLACALYGVLLGLGFTTFVLAFAVWALAGISFAAGEPALGALIGVAFGAGGRCRCCGSRRACATATAGGGSTRWRSSRACGSACGGWTRSAWALRAGCSAAPARARRRRRRASRRRRTRRRRAASWPGSSSRARAR